MLKVQLIPPQELENKHWYVLDLILIAIFGIASALSAELYLMGLNEKIDFTKLEVTTAEAKLKRYDKALGEFKTLDQDIDLLTKKMIALKAITISKVSKSKPVVVLEHLQALKGNGVWLKQIKYDDETLEVKGGTFDNVLVAEFMLALRETQNKDFISSDVRTLVYFSDIQLIKSLQLLGADPMFTDVVGYSEFELKMKVKERAEISKNQRLMSEVEL